MVRFERSPSPFKAKIAVSASKQSKQCFVRKGEGHFAADCPSLRPTRPKSVSWVSEEACLRDPPSDLNDSGSETEA